MGGGEHTTVEHVEAAQGEIGGWLVGVAFKKRGSSAGSYQSGNRHEHKTCHGASEEGSEALSGRIKEREEERETK